MAECVVMNIDIRDRLADLRHARGMLALHNKDLTAINQQIRDAEAAIAVEEDLASAQAEVLQAEASENRAEQITAARREIEDLKSASAKSSADSRAGYVAGAAAMKTHLQTEASLRKLQAKLNGLTGERTPIVNEHELKAKRALQIAQVGIRPIDNHPSYFGGLAGKISYPNTLKEWKD
jgi:hypothetical protein